MVLWHIPTLPVKDTGGLIPSCRAGGPSQQRKTVWTDFTPESQVGNGTPHAEQQVAPHNGVCSISGSEQHIIHSSSLSPAR